jgi:hypothetical protein
MDYLILFADHHTTACFAEVVPVGALAAIESTYADKFSALYCLIKYGYMTLHRLILEDIPLDDIMCLYIS